jgi:GTP pyrophosphokinase
MPGDKIIAYKTTKRKIAVHRENCPNIQRKEIQEKLVNINWNDIGTNDFKVKLKVKALDRPNLLMEILKAITKSKAKIFSTNARTEGTRTICDITLEVKNQKQLEQALKNLSKVKGTKEVERV